MTASPHSKLLPLMVAAVGIVYGDIGTSPLYAIKECFNGHHAVPLTRENVLGVLSLMVWAMTIVVSIKYVMLILRADNKGEGGILALMALASRAMEKGHPGRIFLVFAGMFGAALFFGDGVITPVMTVLSAVEGLEVATPHLKPYVIPIALVILFFLFFFQNRGTEKVGRLFGPIMVVWFVVLIVTGVWHIFDDVSVLHAINPAYAFHFAVNYGWHTFFVLGAVFLVMTGGEALYADIGHFGRKPIARAWFSFVMPALLINYFGQGALLLAHPETVSNPFYYLVPQVLLVPLLILATMAAIIASQAVISGVFSVTRQAIQLGFLPRMTIKHTSAETMGQIYVPAANWAMLVTVVALVFAFRSSTNIAAAYGIAVSLTMVLEILLVLLVVRKAWGWSKAAVAGLALFVLVDLIFFAANALKITQGGWFPLLMAALIVLLMATWRQGRRMITDKIREQLMPMDIFMMSVEGIQRVPGTAVFLTRTPEGIPHTLLHNLKHNKVLHERVVLLSIMIDEVSSVPKEQRLQFESLGSGLHRVVAHYGFVEEPNVPELLEHAGSLGFEFDLMDTTFFLGRETLLPSKKPGMSIWREHIFSWMWKNATSAMEFLKLPPNRVVELGAQIEI
jgi:KUP system potassium uptake protein